MLRATSSAMDTPCYVQHYAQCQVQHALEWTDINTKYSMSLVLGIDTHEKMNIVLGHKKRERGSHLSR